jgi:uncharacterized phage infection (PIP) family protein YhgE
MEIFKKLTRNKLFMLGLLVPIIFQIIYLSIAIPAIREGNTRITDLSIAVVNEDTILGSEVSSKLLTILPFKTEKLSGLEDAIDEMENGVYNMVVYIPSDFTLKIQQGGAQISYYINQAAPGMTKQVMESTSININQILNESSFDVVRETLKQNSSAVLGQLSLPEDVQTQISGYITQAFDTLNYNSITADIQKVNNADGFAQTVLPFFIFLIYFVSCVLMTILHLFTYKSLGGEFSNGNILASQLITNVIISLVIPGVVIGLLACFGIPFSINIGLVWLLLSVGFFTFLYVIQAFTNWFGMTGMLIVALLFPLQLVCSGLIYSKEILPSFYSLISDYLPATYFGSGTLRIFYGENSISYEILNLLVIAAVMLILSTLSVFKKNKSAQTISC